MILKKCMEEGDLATPIQTKYSHPTMVSDGLLEEAWGNTYRLTTKAIGLLYVHYGKGMKP
jgi:hypothetical protein